MYPEVPMTTPLTWTRVRLTCLILLLTLCLVIFATRWVPRRCHHDTTVVGLAQYKSSIDLQKGSSQQRIFIQAVIDGQVVGQPRSKFQTVLPKAAWSSASEHGGSITYWVPSNHKGIPESNELWLTISEDYQCGHVASAEFWIRPVH